MIGIEPRTYIFILASHNVSLIILVKYTSKRSMTSWFNLQKTPVFVEHEYHKKPWLKHGNRTIQGQCYFIKKKTVLIYHHSVMLYLLNIAS